MYSTREELDINGSVAARLITPDHMAFEAHRSGMLPMDYGYVNYHDSGRTTASQPRGGDGPDIGMTPTRSILKNKQAYEVEPRAIAAKDAVPGPGGILGRLRRHLSTEKSMSPTTTHHLTSNIRFGVVTNGTTTATAGSYRYESLNSLLGSDGPDGTNDRIPASGGTTESSAKNKRSFLNLRAEDCGSEDAA
uniref:Uncharacterized protein n=1 Tax=Ditylenchus dipsaci TaxID=166011 RepID=A0A915CVD9_9BILA